MSVTPLPRSLSIVPVRQKRRRRHHGLGAIVDVECAKMARTWTFTVPSDKAVRARSTCLACPGQQAQYVELPSGERIEPWLGRTSRDLDASS